MALTDTERALLVLKEYRYHDEPNYLVEARNDAAGEYKIATSLNEDAAEALAKKIAADNVAPRLFTVEVEGLLWLDWFKGGPPQWRTVFDHDALDKNMKAISVKCRFSTGTSTVEVRG